MPSPFNFCYFSVSPKPVVKIESTQTGEDWRVVCAQFINMNKQIVAAYEGGSLRVFDTKVKDVRVTTLHKSVRVCLAP